MHTTCKAPKKFAAKSLQPRHSRFAASMAPSVLPAPIRRCAWAPLVGTLPETKHLEIPKNKPPLGEGESYKKA